MFLMITKLYDEYRSQKYTQDGHLMLSKLDTMPLTVNPHIKLDDSNQKNQRNSSLAHRCYGAS
jgi:hypothetical protein